LKELSVRLPLARVLGSDLAIFSPAWDIKDNPARDRYLNAIGEAPASDVGLNPWSVTSLR
jgi:hypothetical protein